MSQEIFAACAEKDLKKVLIGVRSLEGRISAFNAYDIVDKQFPNMRDRSVITQCAVVDLKENEDRDRFFENVAVNRGFELRIFSDTDEAITWLNK